MSLLQMARRPDLVPVQMKQKFLAQFAKWVRCNRGRLLLVPIIASIPRWNTMTWEPSKTRELSSERTVKPN